VEVVVVERRRWRVRSDGYGRIKRKGKKKRRWHMPNHDTWRDCCSFDIAPCCGYLYPSVESRRDGQWSVLSLLLLLLLLP
jgi:hypothetical protein